MEHLLLLHAVLLVLRKQHLVLSCACARLRILSWHVIIITCHVRGIITCHVSVSSPSYSLLPNASTLTA